MLNKILNIITLIFILMTFLNCKILSANNTGDPGNNDYFYYGLVFDLNNIHSYNITHGSYSFLHEDLTGISYGVITYVFETNTMKIFGSSFPPKLGMYTLNIYLFDSSNQVGYGETQIYIGSSGNYKAWIKINFTNSTSLYITFYYGIGNPPAELL